MSFLVGKKKKNFPKVLWRATIIFAQGFNNEQTELFIYYGLNGSALRLQCVTSLTHCANRSICLSGGIRMITPSTPDLSKINETRHQATTTTSLLPATLDASRSPSRAPILSSRPATNATTHRPPNSTSRWWGRMCRHLLLQGTKGKTTTELSEGGATPTGMPAQEGTQPPGSATPARSATTTEMTVRLILDGKTRWLMQYKNGSHVWVCKSAVAYQVRVFLTSHKRLLHM